MTKVLLKPQLGGGENGVKIIKYLLAFKNDQYIDLNADNNRIFREI